MSQSLTEILANFTDPEDEKQLRVLDELVTNLDPDNCGPEEFHALINVFERFPEDDGFEVFWGLVHFLEACSGYESTLIESVTHQPVNFTLLMINRLINGGITQVNGHSLLSVLSSARSNPRATNSAKEAAQHYIEYQTKKLNFDAEYF